MLPLINFLLYEFVAIAAQITLIGHMIIKPIPIVNIPTIKVMILMMIAPIIVE